MGNFTHFSNGDGKIGIGDYVRIGPSVTILSSSRNFRRKDLLIIDQDFSHGNMARGDDFFIGASVASIKGFDIGKSAIDGANSVMNKDVSPYLIVVWSPAKVIGETK